MKFMLTKSMYFSGFYFIDSTLALCMWSLYIASFSFLLNEGFTYNFGLVCFN